MEPGGPAQDLPAGPTEAMVIADGSADPEFVALDLLSQAEHGEDAHVLLVCLNERLALAVQQAIARQLRSLPRRKVLEKSLSSRRIAGSGLAANGGRGGQPLRARTTCCCRSANPRAPAGATYATPAPCSWAPGRRNPAAITATGPTTCCPPTAAPAGPAALSLADFYKRISVQELSRDGIEGTAGAIATLARIEGLEAHARAAEARCHSPKDG